jgi:signal transduction histidine kinase/ABC-type uncharacterized transport system substrate-binding protein
MNLVRILRRTTAAPRSKARHSATPFWLIFLLIGVASGQTPAQKDVLIINEVGLAHPASALVMEQVMASVSADPRYQTEFYVESLDSPLVSNEALRRESEARLLEKYAARKVDVIVAMGPAPIRLLAQHSNFQPEVPIVFCGGTREQAGDVTLSSRFTGSWLKPDVGKTVEAAMLLMPDLRHLFVISGSSQFDKTALKTVKSNLEEHPFPLEITYLTDLDMSSLLERLRHLPPQSAVLFVSFFRDASGRQFVNATTALPLVSKAASAPVFGVSDRYLEHGSVGGYVLSYADQGKIAAQRVTDLFAGKRPAEIPILTSPSVYMFDWKELKRWKLSESKLPAGSIVIAREPTVWQKARWILLPALAVILALSVVAAYLLYNQKQLRAARKEQIRLSGMLIRAQEEERRRLAGELHDDFSQRLALLSLELETATESLPDAPQEFNEQMNELINSASEIGADLHTLSHRLHSSTLERLGLAAGVASFCKEFAAHEGTQVAFRQDDLPRTVSPVVALCLFRIVQEALRNVKKHSGASNAQVSLETENGELHLSISDDGRGFDVQNVSTHQGLGLWSMQERVQLIRGRFEITSKEQKGTRIDVWAPVDVETESSHEILREGAHASAAAPD